MKRAISAMVAAAGAATGIVPAASGTVITWQTVALSGQQAGGVEPGTVYATVSPPRVAADGSVVFFATLGPPGLDPTIDEGVFLHSHGVTWLVVRESDDAPWYAPDTRFVGLSDFAVDGQGRVTLAASIDDPAQGDPYVEARSMGIFSEIAGPQFAALARTDEQAAGFEQGVLYSTINSPTLTVSGVSYFTGNRGTGLWSDRTGATTLLVRQGDGAPGAPAGSVFDHLDTPAAVEGALAFRATFDTGSGERPAQGVWVEKGGVVSPVALAGDPAPGTTATFGVFASEVALSEAERIAFWASLSDTPPGTEQGLWSDRDGALALVVRSGDAAPGAPGATIATLSHRPRLNVNGDAAFHAALGGAATPADNGAIYVARSDGSFALVARESDQVYDQPAGVVLLTLGEPMLNGRGQVAFTASLAGSGVTTTTNDALLATDRAGRLFTIVREGDQVDPDGLGLRAVQRIIIDGSDPARGRSPFNDDGTLAFALEFADGSVGAFTATLGSPADFNGDGTVDSRDIFAFLNAYTAADPAADFNRDGAINTLDVLAFIAAFVAE